MTEMSDFLPPRPWTVAPLTGKYYGTEVLDGNGATLCTIWLDVGESGPSERECKDGEEWEYDNHCESKAGFAVAQLIVEAANRV